MENAAAMYQEADDESRQWEGFLLVLHRVFYSEAFSAADIVEKMNGKTAVPGSFGSEPTAHAKELKASLPGSIQQHRFKSRKKVETTLIAAPLSLIVNPKKQSKIETK